MLCKYLGKSLPSRSHLRDARVVIGLGCQVSKPTPSAKTTTGPSVSALGLCRFRPPKLLEWSVHCTSVGFLQPCGWLVSKHAAADRSGWSSTPGSNPFGLGLYTPHAAPCELEPVSDPRDQSITCLAVKAIQLRRACVRIGRDDPVKGRWRLEFARPALRGENFVRYGTQALAEAPLRALIHRAP